MHKGILLIIFILLSGIMSEAQNSSLYDSEGYLRADSAYQVPIEQIQFIYNLETDGLFHKIYRDFEYPWICYENGIGGLVIAEIILNKKDLSVSCSFPHKIDVRLGNAVKKAVYNNSLDLLKRVPIEGEIAFYLPFMFEVSLKKFDVELKKNGFIIVEKSFLEPKEVFL